MFKRLRSYRSHKDEGSPNPPLSTTPADRHPSVGSTSDGRRKRSSTSGVPSETTRRLSELTLSVYSGDRGLSPSPDRRGRGLSPSPDRRDRGPSPSPDRRGESLGLRVIHQPSSTAPLDIIFVHGLGGDSWKTWSKDHNPSLFWPQIWLPSEPVICEARILSFGYNASFRGATKNISNTADFAKDLLYEMKFGTDENGDNIGIGKVPILFVVHSMGGLVVKKAYLLGQIDENYQEIVRSISAIVFLATPHRGTNLADLLNRMLAVTFQSPKSFISDLNKSSPALEELNEQFRHIAPKLSIVSFYETLATAMGSTMPLSAIQIQVLEKDSSILGYPGEISKPLDADHHSICKYSSPQDPNYVSVRNQLRSLVGRFRLQGASILENETSEEAKEIESLFALSQAPEGDLNFYQQRWMPGTCEWLLLEPNMRRWLGGTLDSCIVWLTAPPASGKSVLSSHIIRHLRDSGHPCQYFFFKFGDQTKRTINVLLRSIALQIAKDIPAFRRKLLELSAGGLKLEKTDSSIIWHRIFESILFKMEFDRTLYWVIDGLDESDSPKTLVNLLSGLSRSSISIRILLVGRNTESLSLAIKRLSGSTEVVHIDKEGMGHNTSDIQVFVEKEVKHMRGNDELKRKTKESVLRRADGNFLWVRLVMEEILGCHTEQAIQETLEDMPEDMNKLYQRMEQTITNSSRKGDRSLAKTLLEWTICAHRALTLQELAQALKPEFPEFLDLKSTVQDVCKQFIVVDHTSHVAMVHQTARDYLIRNSDIEGSMNLRNAHAKLFIKTMNSLFDPKLRSKLAEGQQAVQETDPFLLYAAVAWSYHLRHAVDAIDELLDLLVKFLKGPYVLAWINALALICQLEVLVKAAKTLASFASLARKLNANRNPMLHRLRDLELLDSWVVDIVKIVGKFSRHLLAVPTAIYKLIPPFCPEGSVLYQQFYQPSVSRLRISGVSNRSWDDNLAKISLPNGDQGWKIVCAGHYFAVLSSTGSMLLWNSANFAEVITLRHGEPVTAMCFNAKGNKFVSYGLRSTMLWSVPSGQLLSTTSNPGDVKAMTISFADQDTKIFVGSDDRVIRFLRTEDSGKGWQVLDADLLNESSLIDGTFVNSPMCMAFNADATQVGVSYRGFPLSVWATKEDHPTKSRLLGRLKRAQQFRADQGRPSTTWFAVDRFTWNPATGHIIGCYKDGCIFKWNPLSDENQEIQASADEIAASPDGRLFITSDSNGTIKVWNFEYFTVIYQLSSEDLVTDMVFGPDSKRFYDLRGSSVNAWEPNSLIRFSETQESLSDVASEDHSPTSISHVSEAWVAHFEPICALASLPKSSLYCAGNEQGTVTLFDTRRGKLMEAATFLNFLGVSHLTWGEDGKSLVAADLGGEILARRLIFSAVGSAYGDLQLGLVQAPKLDLDGQGIRQILLDQHSSLLLVTTQDLCQIWTMEEGLMQASRGLEGEAARIWLRHPYSDLLLLGFGPNDLRVLRWNDLENIAYHHFRANQPRLNSQASFQFSNSKDFSLARVSTVSSNGHDVHLAVTKAMLTQDGRHFMIQISESRGSGRVSKRLLIIKASSILSSDEMDATGAISYDCLPDEIDSKIEVPLGVLLGSQLVFLDHDLWVCTYKLGSTYKGEALKRHYFVPRDWAGSESLEQCLLLEDGTLLFPKDGEVAVIRSEIGASDF